MSVVTVTIKSDGTVVDPELELLYVDVAHEYNKLPSAEIGYVDGDFSREEFKVSDSALFEPGKEIEIQIGYEGEAAPAETVFKGLVLKHALQSGNNGCSFIAELTDKAAKMTSARKSLIMEQAKDSDVISKLISANGLTAGSVDATGFVHKSIVQYNVTDWDFIVSRAEVNGLLISVEDGKVSAKKPSLAGNPVLTIELGLDEIYDFEVEADARNQYASIESSFWDMKKQQLTTPKTAKKFPLKQGNLTTDALSKVLNNKKDTLISAVSIEEDEAQAWADAKMVRNSLAMLKGRIKVAGTAKAKVGSLIKVAGIGKRFSGTALITGVRHQLVAGEWTTDIQFGLDAEGFLSKHSNVVTPKAAGLLPGVNGLQVGIVTKFQDDPDKEDRVLVEVPAIDNDNQAIWARIVSIDAGKERGVVFWPEPGDEVVIGFLNDDPRQPVILGSVHSSANASPVKGADNNPEKGFVTRDGLKLMFNDEEKTITISTSDDNVIKINEKEKSIEVKDANNNSVLLSDKGISLNSDQDIIIKSGGNVKIEGQAVEIKGNKVDVI